MCTGKVGVFQQTMTINYVITQSFVCECLEKGRHYVPQTQKKTPNASENQQNAQKTKIRRPTGDALKVSETPEAVIDSESYFTFSGSEMPANASFYAGAGNVIPHTVKFQFLAKFRRKLQVWVGISPRGVTRPVICPSSGNIDGKFYREECLKKALLSFLALKYRTGGYIFYTEKTDLEPFQNGLTED